MDPLKAKKLFSLMKEFGVEYFKNEGLEIKMPRLEPLAPQASLEKPIAAPKGIAKRTPELQAIPPVEMPIPHHVNEVANLLKLDDYALVDKLFPDYSQITPVAEGE